MMSRETSKHIGLIGLGVMGQRMLSRLAGHPGLKPVIVWDADASAKARVKQAWPDLELADSAETLIATPGLHSLYIATPPTAHLQLSELAFDAGLAVLCEKPLAVDLDAALPTIARIERERLRAGVNFSLASSTGLATLQRAFGAASHQPLGELQSVELELSFAVWPRPWQAGAGDWLAQRGEGGFGREVLSHFVFALQRVLGQARVLASQVEYPADGIGAETGLKAELDARGVPVRIWGRVGGPLADHNRMLWRGSRGEIELSEWFGRIRVREGSDGEWRPLGEDEDLRSAAVTDQLDHWNSLIEGRSHCLPGFAEALATQRCIESILHGVS
jgi:predicted dehydrogenase